MLNNLRKWKMLIYFVPSSASAAVQEEKQISITMDDNKAFSPRRSSIWNVWLLDACKTKMLLPPFQKVNWLFSLPNYSFTGEFLVIRRKRALKNRDRLYACHWLEKDIQQNITLFWMSDLRCFNLPLPMRFQYGANGNPTQRADSEKKESYIFKLTRKL